MDWKVGRFNFPLLLAIEANTQLKVGIWRKVLFLYKEAKKTVGCCVARHIRTEVILVCPGHPTSDHNKDGSGAQCSLM
jgi:hypothetical protein